MTDNERRYLWLRENWETISGTTWREPVGPKLDEFIDGALAGIEAAEAAFPSGVSRP